MIRSKRNSQTTVIGPPGQPIWNQVSSETALQLSCVSFYELLLIIYIYSYIQQDFLMLVANPMKEKLSIEVKDSLGFTDLTVGTAEVRYLRFTDKSGSVSPYLKIAFKVIYVSFLLFIQLTD